jgi:radical SAM protein with 4Fe4S-binding SPASM domain
METEIFESVVTQAVELGVQHVVPFINGEPLIDPRMPKFIDWMARTFPRVNVCIFTNGSLLTRALSARLLSAGNVKDFNVSMQGGTKEVYEANTGLSWEKTLENVDDLIEVNEALGEPSMIRMNMCVFSKTQDTLDEFVHRWEGRASVCLGAFSNFGGLVHDEAENAMVALVRHVCARATTHLYVYWNGDVGQCCFDLKGGTVYGNLKDEKLVDVLRSSKYLAMREAHQHLNVAEMPPVCKECNACKFDG